MTDGYKIKRVRIWVNEEYNDMQGPCDDGFHIPLNSEFDSIKTIWTAFGGGSGNGAGFSKALKMPYTGYRTSNSSSGVIIYIGSYGHYWSCTSNSGNRSQFLYIGEGILNITGGKCSMGYSIRPFKNTPVTPTSSWTKMYGTSIEAGGIFWSSTDGLISLSSDGSTWITISDKNLGANTVYNYGDTLSAANCGKYYQRGNNYGFDGIGGSDPTTSSTAVDASTYGPGNYYNSSTFITGDYWDSSNNTNLRGGVTQGSGTRFVEKQIYPSTH